MKLTTTIFQFFVIAAIASLTISQASSANTISKPNGSLIYDEQQGRAPDLKTSNGRILVESGLRVGDVKSTNGRITLEKETTAQHVATTNGRIHIKSESVVDSVHTTNGRIEIDASKVKGNVKATNGSIRIEDGSHVRGKVVSANGSIQLGDSTVDENLEISHGNVTLIDSAIEGDLIIHPKKRGWGFNWKNKKPEIIIGPESVVMGTIIAKQDIELYVHESAKVGKITGAEPRIYSGNKP